MDTEHRPYLAPVEGYTGPKRSLILAGGGMRVAYQAGVVRALFEAGLSFGHADGTSGGVINLAMLMSGLSPVEMCDRWRTLKVKDFVSYVPFEQYFRAHDMLAMGDADGIVNKVFPHLGVDIHKINSAQGVVGTFNVCNYTRKTNEVFTNDAVDIDLIVAGMSLPIFMPPVKKGDYLYTDSVWIKDANLIEAVKRGADELWLVWCIGNIKEYKTGFFNQYVHMIELSANGHLIEEFDRIKELNEHIANGEEVYGHTKPIRLHVIKPEYALPLDPEFFFGRISATTLIDMGYSDTRKYLQRMTSEGVPFEPEATMMTDTALGLNFCETMSGPFSLGTSDPHDGAQKGEAAGTSLAIHCNIAINDLHRFLSDPNHLAGMTGHIDFTPFGENIPVDWGTFNLFSPAEDPKLKLMVYQLAFVHHGKSYFLEGKKEVRDDPGLDLWTDTTTLYTQLHEGDDQTGPVVGAGILHIGASGLIKLISTMHPTNASSIKEKSEALLKFGRFFLGELWETYFKKSQDESSGPAA
jgi:predicted patatin/cPLA2 family phospholipase